MASDPRIQITRWLLDTRNVWAGKSIQDAAPQYLELISPIERAGVLRKYHFSDACMSLGSALLKRAFIAKHTNLSWSSIKFSRKLDSKLGKPKWDPPESVEFVPYIDFNVSHQKGIVTLIGICVTANDTEFDVSVDVVSPNERNDIGKIRASNLADFINTFEYVLSDQEKFSIVFTLPTTGNLQLAPGEEISNEHLGRLDREIECGKKLCTQLPDGRKIEMFSDLIIDEKLRNFYATFSLKEAFTKLGGMGLSAKWIKDCQFIDIRAPSKGTKGNWGEKIKTADIDITLSGEPVTDIVIEQQALEEDYIITTMIQPYDLSTLGDLPDWINVDLRTILPQKLLV